MMIQEPNTVQRKSKGVVLLLATLSLILSSCAKYDDEDLEVTEEHTMNSYRRQNERAKIPISKTSCPRRS